MAKTVGSDPETLGSNPSSAASPEVLYSFHEEYFDEWLGILPLYKYPEPGTVITYGFISYKMTTKWLVVGEREDGMILVRHVINGPEAKLD